MPGPQNWTPDLLYQHILTMISSLEQRLSERVNALDRSVQQSNTSSKEAIAKAEVATEKRLEALNELRAMAQGRDAEFIPRVVADAIFQRLGERIDEIRERLDEVKERLSALENTRAGMNRGLGLVQSIILGAAAVVGVGVSLLMAIYTLYR